MEELLTPVSTSYRSSNHVTTAEDHLTEVPKPVPQTSPRESIAVSSPETALQALQAEPDFDTLKSTLRYIVHGIPPSSAFRITLPSPTAAQLVNALVSDTVPNYWNILNEKNDSGKRITFKNGAERKLLLSCLRSVTGLNALLARLKALIQQSKEGKKGTTRPKSVEYLEIYIEVLEAILHGENAIKLLWSEISKGPVLTQKSLWRESVVLLAGSKILNTAAETASTINEVSEGIEKKRWIADGQLYSHWLTSNIINGAETLLSAPDASWRPISELISKSLRLGYTG
jgi:telomere length regulation protein